MIKKVRISKTGKYQIKIYDEKEHKIKTKKIDEDAINIIRKIKSNGEEAYIVGGAVRDLLFHKKPKDFDIATSMHPQKIRHLFKNSMIIGKRFKLVLVNFKDKQIEVATFRGLESREYENQVYGTIEEDASRRDFSVNALYYDPLTSALLDFNTGFEDLKKKELKSIIDLNYTFKEDPVRILRAIKYSIKDGLKIPNSIKNQIILDAPNIEKIGKSRMAEEITKVFISAMSYDIFANFDDFGLMQYILPDVDMKSKALKKHLSAFDKFVFKHEGCKKDDLIALGIYSILKDKYLNIDENHPYFSCVDEKKSFMDAAKDMVKKDFNDLNFANFIYKKAALMLILKKNPENIIS